MRVPSARTERPTMRSGAPFGPEWVKGGCRRQADGTAGLPPAPEMPCAPRAVTLGAKRRSAWLRVTTPPPRSISPSSACRVGGANFDLLAIFEIDGRVHHDEIACFDAFADLHLGSKVADFGDLVLTHHAVFYYEHVDPLGIEHDRRVRHDQGWRFARDLKLDGGIHPWAQFTIGVGDVDFGQQGSRPRVQGVGDACNLAGKWVPGDFRNPHDSRDPGLDPNGRLLRHKKLDAHDVAVRYREHKGAARRVGLDQAADIDVALGDDTVERGDDPLIGLLLLEHLDLGLLRLDGRGICVGCLRLRREVQSVGVALLLRGPALPDQDGVAPPIVRGELAIGLSLAQGAILYLANPATAASMAAWGRYGPNCL